MEDQDDRQHRSIYPKQHKDRIHTTAMGVDRIKKNLSLNEVDVVEWCKSKIMSKKAEISKQGKIGIFVSKAALSL